MRLGILSDTHNDHVNITAALGVMKNHGVSRIIHCGDISSTDTVWLFAGWQVEFVYGNLDTDRSGLARVIADFQFKKIDDILHGEAEGLRYAACHGHRFSVVETLLNEKLYDYLFVGHSHRRKVQKAGRTTIINPGALGGRQPESRSVAILNTLTQDIRFYQVKDGKEID